MIHYQDPRLRSMISKLKIHDSMTKLTQVGQQPEEIFAKHGLVGVFVVQLQDLNEIVDATGVLGVLGLLEEGIHVLEDNGLLALLLLTTNFRNGLHGGVQVAGTNEVTNVETINLAISLEVIDIKSEVDGINLLLLKTKLLQESIVNCMLYSRSMSFPFRSC